MQSARDSIAAASLLDVHGTTPADVDSGAVDTTLASGKKHGLMVTSVAPQLSHVSSFSRLGV